jgi:hypothetical protein
MKVLSNSRSRSFTTLCVPDLNLIILLYRTYIIFSGAYETIRRVQREIGEGSFHFSTSLIVFALFRMLITAVRRENMIVVTPFTIKFHMRDGIHAIKITRRDANKLS